MKECLVIVLVLSLTGMVVGQQSGSHSSFDHTRTDSTRATSPSSSSPSLSGSSSTGSTTRSTQSPGSQRRPLNTLGAGSATSPRGSQPAQTDSVEQIMKLDINDQMIEAIKAGHTLEAPIDLRDVTNGIVMMFDDPTTLKPRVDQVPRNLQPTFESGNGVLHFTLDEVGLERLKTEGLQYEYRPGEKGKYQQVALKFVPSSSARHSPVTTSPVDFRTGNDRVSTVSDNAFGTDRTPIKRNTALTREDFGTTPRRTDRNPTLASSTKTEGERYFERQQTLDRQKEIDRQHELARQQQLDRQHVVDTTRTFGIDHSRDNRKSDWNLPRLKHNTNPHTHTFELTDDEIDALATSTNHIRNERERRETDLERMRLEKLAADRRAQQAEADRLRLIEELRGNGRVDQTSIARRRTLDDGLYTSYGQRNLFPSDRTLTRTTTYDPRVNSYLADGYSDRITPSDSTRLQIQEAALENERLRLQLARAETDRTRLAAQNRLADLGGNLVNDPLRNATNNQRSPLRMSDYGASIPGTQPQNNRRQPGANGMKPMTSAAGPLMTETAVDHILLSYDGQNFQQVANRVKGEVAAISAAKNRVDKFNGFLLFLFITFFALSLYLGWLAQSFYGQYGELADELRETFTATT